MSGRRMVLYDENKLPIGVFKVKRIAKIEDDKWIWCWEDRDNFIDKHLYPKGLRTCLDTTIKESPEEFTKIVASLIALQGEWYVYLHDRNNVKMVIVITKVYKLYKNL
jgi:hypothetical protein